MHLDTFPWRGTIENAVETEETPTDRSVSPDWRAKLARLQGAYAETTIRGYGADFGAFARWCEREQQTALPASPETVADFITACASGSNRLDELGTQGAGDAPATLVRRLAAIRKVHRLMRMSSPVEDEEVKTALRRAIRAKGRRQHQALGLTINIRDAMIAACSGKTLMDVRDRAIVAVGYDTLCRRAELVALRTCDLTDNADGSVTVVVRRSKADPLGNGRTAFLTQRAARLLKDWLEAAGIEEGPLFRSLARGELGQDCLNPCSVSRILKRAAERAGYEEAIISELSSHSLRIGAAQDMSCADFGILSLMAAGGWKSVAVVSRYVEKALVVHVGRTRETRLEKRFGAPQEPEVPTEPLDSG